MNDDRRLTELLHKASREKVQPIYERHGIGLEDGPDRLVEEICLDGSNTFASLLRGGKGTEYINVVRDVARKVGIKDNNLDAMTVKELEKKILALLISNYVEELDEKELAELKTDLIQAKLDEKVINNKIIGGLTKGGALALLSTVAGREIVVGIIGRVVATYVGTRTAATVATRAVGAAIPFLNVALFGWLAWDLSGPAFRKTIPTIIDIAILRLKLNPKQ
nr:hypothetical protein [uncultured Pseudodesulfovibrio sp.]